MEETMSKRPRLWNPAIEEMNNDKNIESNNQIDHRATAFALATLAAQHQLLNNQPNPFFMLQPYLSMMPFISQNIQSSVEQPRERKQQKKAEKITVKQVSPVDPVLSSSPLSSLSIPSSSSTPTTSFNPLVKSALGIHVPNENCCAICGADFRLTSDLVTHMRNNHRTTRFRKRADEGR